MLAKRIIPCLDVRNGKVTKGVQFIGNLDIGDPVAMARYYYHQGADEIVFGPLAPPLDDLVEERPGLRVRGRGLRRVGLRVVQEGHRRHVPVTLFVRQADQLTQHPQDERFGEVRHQIRWCTLLAHDLDLLGGHGLDPRDQPARPADGDREIEDESTRAD